MKITSVLAAAVAVLAPVIQAQYAQVFNNCTFPAWVHSVPYDPNTPPNNLTKLPPLGLYAEPFFSSGSTLKLGTTAKLTHPLFGGYSLGTNPFDLYYEFKDLFGNPFVAFPNSMTVGRAGCPGFRCAAGEHSPNCYSTGQADATVYACKRPTNVTVTLCGIAK